MPRAGLLWLSSPRSLAQPLPKHGSTLVPRSSVASSLSLPGCPLLRAHHSPNLPQAPPHQIISLLFPSISPDSFRKYSMSRLLFWSWAELKLVTTRVGMPRHRSTGEERKVSPPAEALQTSAGPREPHLQPQELGTHQPGHDGVCQPLCLDSGAHFGGCSMSPMCPFYYSRTQHDISALLINLQWLLMALEGGAGP